MKKLLFFAILIIAVALNCAGQEDPLLCHLYGWIIDEADSTTGVNGLNLQIWDINPDDFSISRQRAAITRTDGSQAGFFEIDSVCYGTTKQQGTGYVAIVVDTLDNPGWPFHTWRPNIYGDVDTIRLYISH